MYGAGGGEMIIGEGGSTAAARPPGKKAAQRGTRAGWWRNLSGDDVISLEPLAELPYEPFQLRAQIDPTASGGTDPYNYFDGGCSLFSSCSQPLHSRFIPNQILCTACSPRSLKSRQARCCPATSSLPATLRIQ